MFYDLGYGFFVGRDHVTAAVNTDSGVGGITHARKPGMKEYVPTYPNPEDEGRLDWERKLRPLISAAEDINGEGALPSSLTTVHKLSAPDPAYDLQLLRDLKIANERTLREFGPLPPGGLPVQEKCKPKVPYRDFLGRIVSEIHRSLRRIVK